MLEGKIVVVSGAGDGIGAACAEKMLAQGAEYVAVADIDVTKGRKITEALNGKGHSAEFFELDVRVEAQWQAMFDAIIAKHGRVDVLVNNAGILRDKSFAKMEISDFQSVVDVHLMGSVNCTKAVWGIMREQNYGRIVMTTSSSGMYGNFGQSNYGAAKMAVLGLMNTLVIEGAKNDIRINALAPTAGTRMTEDLMPEEIVKAFAPEAVTAGMLTLCDDEAPNRFILCAGAGGYSSASMFETEGCFIPQHAQTPEIVREHWHELTAQDNQAALESGSKQGEKFVMKAMAYMQSQQK